MLEKLQGDLQGLATSDLADVVERLEGYLANDPDYSFQVTAYRRGELILDAWGGPHLKEDSLIVPWSVTKATIGFSVALLLERGQLDLDETVAHYWPEFAAKGKDRVTVRQLLSHQAGLPQAHPPLTFEETIDPHEGARRLAESTPYWHPGTAFGYHAGTIGNLGAELVFRVTGTTLHEFYENEIRSPYDIDFYLGLPEELDERLFHFLPMVRRFDDDLERPVNHLQPVVFGSLGNTDFGADERSYRYGHPGGSGTASARGIARLYAAGTTGVGDKSSFLSRDSVEAVSQQQVRGYDEVLGFPNRAHGIVFQKPLPGLQIGGPWAFGHDGAMGALGWADPDAGIAFGFTVGRCPWPGGADARAVQLVAELIASA